VDVLDGADIQQDIAKEPLPFEKGSVDAIYCSHVLEHIWPWRLPFVLEEFRRVLTPHGRVRIVVPDMDIAIREIVKRDFSAEALTFYMRWWFNPTQDSKGEPYLSHVGGFNWNSLLVCVTAASFRKITRMQYGKHSSVFEGCDNPGHASTSVYLEAIK
jgi:SAM-dependent methyltransferase